MDTIKEIWIKFTEDTLLPIHCGYLRFKIKKLLEQTREIERDKIKSDLLKIADEGEIEDLRREVLKYFL